MSNIIGKTLINQFRVDAFIASGGMGAVYRVWDLKRNVPLAMKVLHSELAEDPSMFRRFQREANALKKLAHPNIVPFYGFYQTDQFDFLLERFIDGPSLKDILKQRQGKPLPLNEALVYLKALCAALGYAHASESKVVHCDVKPGNVMVDRGGSVYLTDFGIARHAESTTTTMGAAGTAAYMAPEQIRGEPVTAATDIYSLGVVLYEMLTGQRPFRGTEAGTEKGGATANERIRYGHLKLQPPDPRSINPTLPEGLTSAILKALSKDPRNRYGSTQDFFNTICSQAGVTVGSVAERVTLPAAFTQKDDSKGQEGPGTPPPPVPSPRQRSPWLIGGVLVVCFLAIGALVYLLSHGGTGPASGSQPSPISGYPLSSTAILAMATSNSQPGGIPLDVIPTLSMQLFTPSQTFIPTQPSSQSITGGEWIAYAYGPYQYERNIYKMNLDTGEVDQFTFIGNETGDNSPSFSPDGKSIVFWRYGSVGSLIVKKDENGIETTLTNTKSAFPSWCRNPSKPWIIYENRNDEGHTNIWMIDLNTRKEEPLTNGGDDGGPQWSPDCSSFSFIRDNAIYIKDINTGSEHRLNYTPPTSIYSIHGPRWSPDGEWLVFNLLIDTNGDGFPRTTDDVSDLILIKTDGSGEQNLTQGQYWAYQPSWSPDGSKILFIDQKPPLSSNNCRLMIYDLQQSSFTPVNDSSGPYYHASWGP
jgi:serine/threonine protein kinase